jgi:hypothetical protein
MKKVIIYTAILLIGGLLGFRLCQYCQSQIEIQGARKEQTIKCLSVKIAD